MISAPSRIVPAARAAEPGTAIAEFGRTRPVYLVEKNGRGERANPAPITHQRSLAHAPSLICTMRHPPYVSAC